MMSKNYDDDDDTAVEEALDMHWNEGPLAQARQNLNVFCSDMLMQKSLQMIVEETLLLEDIIGNENVSIVDKVNARQTLAILTHTWAALVDQLGYRT